MRTLFPLILLSTLLPLRTQKVIQHLGYVDSLSFLSPTHTSSSTHTESDKTPWISNLSLPLLSPTHISSSTYTGKEKHLGYVNSQATMDASATHANENAGVD